MDALKMFHLDGKTAIVTGASRGIGEAIAHGYAKVGADLVLVSRNRSALEKVAQKIEGSGRKALPIAADIGNPEEIQRAVDTTLKVFPRIDILVNNAGISPILKKAEEVTLKEWEEIMRVNLTGTFLFCQAVGKVMIQQGGGKIINMASVRAVVAFPRQIAYCVTKGGILQLTKVLAIEWARYNIQVNAIGPAGENLIRFAVIENDYWRSLGRTGVGAVMGSKKIKAIVFHGEKKREVAHPDRLEQFAKETLERGKDSPGALAYRRLGTPMLVAMNNAVGGFPSKNWHLGTFEGWEKISAESLIERCQVKPTACLRCFMACGNLSEVKEGRHKGLKIEGPEYETVYAFGGLCMVHEIEEIAFLNDLCDRLGMDTISAGSLCAFTIEASEMERIQEKIGWGDLDKIAELLNRIAYKKGIGATLGEGIRHAAKEWEMENVAIHVKGLDPAGYDPRILKGMGLAYATSDRGACHLRATFYKAELSGMIPSDQMEGKAKLFLEFEDRFNIHDSLILCRFYRDIYWDWKYLSTIVEVTTGLKLDEARLRKISSNIQNETRRFNLREGITSKDDTLPKRFFDGPLGKDGKTIRREDLQQMLQDYYVLRGWSSDGIPKSYD